MRTTSQKERDAVLELDAQARFEHFVKRVVDEEAAWGLWDDGWALMADDDGNEVFPLWPAREYAELCRTDEWASYQPRELSLDELLDELAPKLRESGVRPAIFPTPQGKGATPSVDQLCEALAEEQERYE